MGRVARLVAQLQGTLRRMAAGAGITGARLATPMPKLACPHVATHVQEIAVLRQAVGQDVECDHTQRRRVRVQRRGGRREGRLVARQLQHLRCGG